MLTPEHLRKLRTALDLTQAQAADLCGYSLRQYGGLETGERPICKRVEKNLRLLLTDTTKRRKK